MAVPGIHTVSFGCQMNVADSQEMERALERYGYSNTQRPEEADVILINTCTVRQHAEDRAFSFVGRLREWKEENSNRLLIVAGCAAERTKETLKRRFPFVDLIVGAKSIEKFPKVIDDFFKKNLNHSALITQRSSLTVTSFVTVMRGCNYSCSYCIVPLVRGRESYRSPENILREVEEKTSSGVREITLLGQTVNSYHYGDWSFSKLLQALPQISNLKRIRFMSPHPYFVTGELIETMGTTSQIARHIHLPLQSGSNKILKLMRRNYTREKYLEIVKNLRSQIPDIAITTDVIVGFPMETEEDFKETLNLMQAVGFDSAFYFKYSPREATEAANLPQQAPQSLKEERLQEVLELAEKQASQKAKAYLGKTCDVLFESAREGRTSTNYRVTLREKGLHSLLGRLLPVEITSVKNRKLYGRLLKM